METIEGDTKSLIGAEYWDKHLSTKPYPNPILSRMDYETIKLLVPFLESKRGGDLVEFGCGNSYWLPYFGKTYGFNLYGMDFARGRLRQAQRKLILSGLDGSLICGDFTNPHDFPYGWRRKFDVSYSGGVIEHFQSPSSILRMFAECMRPDGIVITTVPHLKGIWGKLGEKLNKEIVDGHVRMDLGDLVEVHRMAGLEVVYATYFKWLDVSVLNYEKLPLVVKKAIFGAYLGMDMVMNMLVRIYKGKLRPEALYSDMLVVAKK